jgi:predicted porin
MKKLALAAALTATFAGTAFAQSSVTVYGRINTSAEYQDNGKVTATGLKSNASYWGLRGSEDLGDGLSAYFQLEAGFDADTGGGSGGFSRDTYMGLKSASLGQIKLGKFTSALYFGTIDFIGVFNHDSGTPAEDNIWALNSVVFNNGFEYISPKLFGGLEFIVTAVAGEKSGPDTYELAANYDVDELHLSGGYSETKGRDVANSEDVDKSGFALAASYVFGPLVAGISYDHVDVKGTDAYGKRDSVTATAMYTVDNSEFHLSVGHAGKWDDVPDSSATQYTVGYNYNLSKRTKLFAFYYTVDNDSFPYGASLNNSSLPVLSNEKFSSFGVGIRHNF